MSLFKILLLLTIICLHCFLANSQATYKIKAPLRSNTNYVNLVNIKSTWQELSEIRLIEAKSSNWYHFANGRVCPIRVGIDDTCSDLYEYRGAYDYGLTDTIESALIHGCSADAIDISGIRNEVELTYNSLKNLTISRSNLIDVSITGDTIGNCEFSCKFRELKIEKSTIRRLRFYQCEVDRLLTRSSRLPDTLLISELSLGNNLPYLDFTEFENTLTKECALYISVDDLPKVKFNYKNFKLLLYQDSTNKDFVTSLNQTLYINLIDAQKKYGFTEGVEKITKEYKGFEYTKTGKFSGYAINWIDKNWWDYGYNKGLIFRNTFYLMFAFYLFNLIIYKKLLHETYPIEEFLKNDRRIYKPSLQYRIRDAAYCLFYTGYVFLCFRLDFKLLRLKNLWLAGYIILQSIIGLICLAYMANYIISK